MSSRPRILCVDDDPLILAAIQRSLDDERFDVVTASDPTKAVQILEDQGPFAVVMSDLRMPGVDGGSLLESIKQRWPDTVRPERWRRR